MGGGKKSPQDKTPTQITLTNNSRTPIDLVWIDHTGTPKPYKTAILPTTSITQHTYVNHIWLIRDSATSHPLYYFTAIPETKEELVVRDIESSVRCGNEHALLLRFDYPANYPRGMNHVICDLCRKNVICADGYWHCHTDVRGKCEMDYCKDCEKAKAVVPREEEDESVEEEVSLTLEERNDAIIENIK